MNPDEACHKHHDVIPCCEDMMCPCDVQEFYRQESEIRRLRGALELIGGFTLSQFMGPHSMALEMGSVARAALEGSK